MKKIVIYIILSILTIATVQAQRLSLEPELGFRLQRSKVENIWSNSIFLNGPATSRASDYKGFWRVDPNMALCFNTKIKGRWSITTGFQFFQYNNYIYHLENQPWPVGWDEKVLVNQDRIFGLKFGWRYNLFRKSDAKYGASLELGIKYLIRQKTMHVITEDTLPSVPNGYDASELFFYSSGKHFPSNKNGHINQYFPYFSFKPYYRINKNLNLVCSIDFNLIMDIIVISNFAAHGGQSIDINRITPSGKIPGIDLYPNHLMAFGENYNSWNFSLGVQITLIKDKVKKPIIDHAIMEGY